MTCSFPQYIIKIDRNAEIFHVKADADPVRGMFPNEMISDKENPAVSERNQLIFVYCRSGRHVSSVTSAIPTQRSSAESSHGQAELLRINS